MQIPRRRPDDQVDPDAWGLLPLTADSWGGWLFVAMEPRQTLAEHLGELATILEPYGPDGLVIAHRVDYTVSANWKVVAANYHECHHCPAAHPELSVVADPDSDESDSGGPGDWIGGPMTLNPGAATLSIGGRAVGPRLGGVDDCLARQV